MKSQKAKGTQGERELIHLFHQSGWSAVRVAGSGSSRYPSPDILAANAIRRLAIECKVTKERRKYLDLEELRQLQAFAQRFGSESWIGVRFKGEPWYFLLPEDLEQTGTCFAVSVEIARRRGLTAEELLAGQPPEPVSGNIPPDKNT